MITSGVTVLAIVNLDTDSGAAIEKKAAHAQGVKTIDYDRLTLGGSADYYVSFDNAKVGELQGQGLAKCLGASKQKQHHRTWTVRRPTTTPPCSPTAAHKVLEAALRIGTYTKVAEQAVPDWDNQKARHDLRAAVHRRPAARSTACSPPTTASATRPSRS